MDPTVELVERLTSTLTAAGCVAAHDEAVELVVAASGPEHLDALTTRRLAGEPFAWVVGHINFCGLDVLVDSGVYVPRWQSEPLARAASEVLGDAGTAVDLATGSGAIAMVLGAAHPRARVLATEVDPAAIACARRNGVDVRIGSLFDPLPDALRGAIDVAVGVLPYVPSSQLVSLPRDSRDFEPRTALDGGPDGLDVVRSAISQATSWLRRGGTLLMEAGTDQCDAVASALVTHGFVELIELRDHDGDLRGAGGVWSG